MRTIEEIKQSYIENQKQVNWLLVWSCVYLNLVEEYRKIFSPPGVPTEETIESIKSKVQLQLDELFFGSDTLDDMKSKLSQESIYLDEIYSVLSSGRVIKSKELRTLIFEKGIEKSEILADYLRSEFYKKTRVCMKDTGKLTFQVYTNLKKELFQKLNSVYVGRESTKSFTTIKDYFEEMCKGLEEEFD